MLARTKSKNVQNIDCCTSPNFYFALCLWISLYHLVIGSTKKNYRNDLAYSKRHIRDQLYSNPQPLEETQPQHLARHLRHGGPYSIFLCRFSILDKYITSNCSRFQDYFCTFHIRFFLQSPLFSFK